MKSSEQAATIVEQWKTKVDGLKTQAARITAELEAAEGAAATAVLEGGRVSESTVRLAVHKTATLGAIELAEAELVKATADLAQAKQSEATVAIEDLAAQKAELLRRVAKGLYAWRGEIVSLLAYDREIDAISRGAGLSAPAGLYRTLTMGEPLHNLASILESHLGADEWARLELPKPNTGDWLLATQVRPTQDQPDSGDEKKIKVRMLDGFRGAATRDANGIEQYLAPGTFQELSQTVVDELLANRKAVLA